MCHEIFRRIAEEITGHCRNLSTPQNAIFARMTFVHPWLLWGLFLTAIPILIHLFNFRRYKTVYFTNVQFLKEVTEETAVRSKIKHWLVLAARLLAVIFLVLAFAQPVIPIKKNNNAAAGGTHGVSIYVDNSFSMDAEADEEKLLNRAVRRAREITTAYPADARFQLLTNEFTSRQQRLVTKEEFLSMLDEVRLTSIVRTLDEVHAHQQKTFTDAGIDKKTVYWISDFQKNMVDFKGDTTTEIGLLPLQPAQQHNLYIDTAWLEQPALYQDKPATLLVKITNTAGKDVEDARLTLSIDGQVKAIADYSVGAEASVFDTISFSVRDTGWRKLEAKVEDYPVTFDDSYFLALKVTGQVDVLAINEAQEGKYLQALFSNAEKFTFRNQQAAQLDYAKLKYYSLIILNNLATIPSGLAYELKQYLENGGALLVFPDAKADVLSYNNFFTGIHVNELTGMVNEPQPVTYLNKEHELFQDVFEEIPNNISLPEAKLHFTAAQRVQNDEQKLLGFRDGSAFVSAYNSGNGKVYVCTTPLDAASTDFPVHALFVPMLYKMALSGGNAGKASYILGKDEVIEVENTLAGADAIYKMKGAQDEFIPRQKAAGAKVLLTPGEEADQAGIYTVYTGNENEGALVALNYNRSESQLTYYTPSELKEMYPQQNIRLLDAVAADLGGIVKEMEHGIILWRWCIALALLFLGAEVLLLRFLK